MSSCWMKSKLKSRRFAEKKKYWRTSWKAGMRALPQAQTSTLSYSWAMSIWTCNITSTTKLLRIHWTQAFIGNSRKSGWRRQLKWTKNMSISTIIDDVFTENRCRTLREASRLESSI
jgi:hypothetical protein